MKRLLIVVLALLVAGCSYVTPSDRLVIHDHYLNAVAINAKVQVDPALPDYAKTWWGAEERTWKAMDAWAKGKDIAGGE